MIFSVCLSVCLTGGSQQVKASDIVGRVGLSLPVCFSICLSVCLWSSPSVCLWGGGHSKASDIVARIGLSLPTLPHWAAAVLSLLDNGISIAIVLHAVIVIIVKNTSCTRIIKFALVVASAIKFCKGECVQKHCYQLKGGGDARTQVHSGARGWKAYLWVRACWANISGSW